MVWRVGCVVGLLALLGCERQPPPVRVTPGELRLNVAVLEFGELAVGSRLPLTVEASNVGQAPLELDVVVAAPFTVAPAHLSLPGGGTEVVTFTFAPTTVGAASATVSEWPLELRGLGVPACVAQTCQASSFDLATRRCVTAELPDDAPCSTPCLGSQGRCLGGACFGAAAGACDDRDVCTIDGCQSDGGCLHVPAPAPDAGACSTAVCDPVTGYALQPVEDGLLCAQPTCRTAFVCINGECAARPTANVDDDCLYTSVCSWSFGPQFACATTRSGRMRCWGDPDVLGRDGGRSLPDFFGDAGAAAMPVCVQGQPRWLDTQGHLQPDNPIARTGYDTFAALRNDWTSYQGGPGFAFVALTRDGGVLRAQTPNYVTVIEDRGVSALCGTNHYLLDGGAYRVTPPGVAVETGVRTCAGGVNTAFVLSDGTVSTFAGRSFLDGGATLVGSGPRIFAGSQMHNLGGGVVTWPFAPVTVTEEMGQLCGVSDAGALACLGAIAGTPLSPSPDLPIDMPGGPWARVRTRQVNPWLSSVQVTDAMGRVWASLGGFPGRRDGGSSTLVRVGAEFAEPIRDVQGGCVLHGETATCVLVDGGVASQPNVVSIAARYERMAVVTSDARLLTIEGVELDRDVIAGSNEYVRAYLDGGVRLGMQTISVPGPVRAGSLTLWGGCVQAPNGQLWCFDPFGVQAMVLPFGVRRWAGDATRGCAVIGTNSVRCWGLGSRFRAVVIDEAVVEIATADDARDPLACARLQSGKVRCWGQNNFGQLGISPAADDFVGLVE